jgi:small subunit ribosomal protein S3
LGQKTNPIGFRLGIVKTWDSKWFASREYASLLEEDLFIRKYLKTRLSQAGVSKILIERAADKVTVTIRTARPGIVIGRRGQQVDQLRDELQHITSKQILLNVEEVRRPDADAQLVAEHIARQLEQRVSFRRAMKKALTAARRSGALGIRVACSGRLGGSEMARREQYREGRVPLHTLRADIDFAIATAHTTYGCIGVKTWIFHGEKLGDDDGESVTERPGRLKPRQSALASTKSAGEK